MAVNETLEGLLNTLFQIFITRNQSWVEYHTQYGWIPLRSQLDNIGYALSSKGRIRKESKRTISSLLQPTSIASQSKRECFLEILNVAIMAWRRYRVVSQCLPKKATRRPCWVLNIALSKSQDRRDGKSLDPPENGETVAASRPLWGLPQNHRSWRIFIWNCLVATLLRKPKETKSSKGNKFRRWEMKRTQTPNTANHVSQKQAWKKKCKPPGMERTQVCKEQRPSSDNTCLFIQVHTTHVTEAPPRPYHVPRAHWQRVAWTPPLSEARGEPGQADSVPLTFAFNTAIIYQKTLQNLFPTS